MPSRPVPRCTPLRILAAFAVALSFLAVAPARSQAAAAPQWNRSILVYHDPARSLAQWEKHLMRVDANGQFTGQWLFNGAVLTAVDINGKDLMYGGETGTDLNQLLGQLFSDAAQLDAAAAALTARFGAPPAPIGVSIGVPWIDQSTAALALPGGPTLNTAVPAQRSQAAAWYLDQIRARSQAAGWRNLALYGAYYHREDVIDAFDDPAYVTQFNRDAHTRGMKTVWVPYSGAPHEWSAQLLGFDISNVQPSVAFRGVQYAGESDNGRLYAVGAASVPFKQAFEYESSTAGQSPPENWTSHQYLAVEQYFHLDVYPQLFFAGLTGDMFDLITTQAAAVGDRWWCYNDLADYLAGKQISNLEIGLPWPAQDQPDGTRVVQWTAPPGQQLWAVRMDFADDDPANPWRGTLKVRVDGPGGVRTSFAQRAEKTEKERFHSLPVPLALSARGDSTVQSLTITMTRETGAPWPDIQRFIAARYVVPVIANGAGGEISSSTYPIQTGPYADTAPTYSRFAAGKLTDGKASPSGTWNWNGVMGWNSYDGQFAVTIDLGTAREVSEVDLATHFDSTAGIAWPTGTVAMVGLNTPARISGITTISDPAAGTSGPAKLIASPVAGSPNERAGAISLKLDNVLGRYVTVLGVGSGWTLLDEVTVKDETGAVISTGAPYTATPIPSVAQGDQTAYGDNAVRLTNNSVTPYFLPQYSQVLDGIPSGTGGKAEVTWVGARPVRQATIWFTEPNQAYGVVLPPSGTAEWRDQNGVWSKDENVVVIADGAAPHATVVLPFDAQVTGVRAILPPISGSNGWYMISQITAR